MNLPDHLKEKLGFRVIHERLLANCASSPGRSLAANISFSGNPAQVGVWLDQTTEFLQLINQGNTPPLSGINDIDAILEQSAIAGNWVSADDLFKVYGNLQATRLVSEYIFTHTDSESALRSLRVEFRELLPLEKRLQLSIDEEGHVLDGASPELKAIRRKLQSEEGVLRKKVNAIYRKAKSDGLIPDGATIGVRDGRMVIPVTAASKRQIPGFVHDESASGNIVYLEPAMVLEANNAIRELLIAENREIHKILLELTHQVGQLTEIITRAGKYLAEVDFINAKAKLARILDGARPLLTEQNVDLRVLRHPVLDLVSKNDNRTVIPHNLKIDSVNRLILISGPNAGGKSVAMKSVGLNQLMLQSGLLPCCDPDSKFRLFDKIFVDIGDEQSIDNDLSTYSSHLRNMVLMLKLATSDSLILIDEFGSGTDPAFGGAIAEAILDELNKKSVWGVITTHFSNLKLFADKTDGITNAAMLFDLKKLKPLYELEVGRPGSSFSLEVAAKSGIPDHVIKIAEEGVGANQLDIENLLTRLEDEKRRFEQQNRQLAERDKALNQLQNEYRILKKKLEERQKDIINLAKQEASQILAKTNKEIEKTIRHIKENKAEKKETKKIRQHLGAYAEKVKPQKGSPKPEDIEIAEGIPQAGDQALIKDRNVVVLVEEIKGKKARVLMGELQSVVPLVSLTKISNREAKKRGAGHSSNSANSRVNQLITNYTPVLDVRGTRATELLGKLQKFIDESVMLGQQSVKVIHGKGNGVLRQLVRNELKQWSQVDHYEDEHIERGGDGATVVIFK